MKTEAAVGRLAALAQETRLELFRRLVRRGPDGQAAGEIAAALGIPKPTLSFHLAALERAGLVRSARRGRSIVYAADYGAMAELVGFLYENCCGEGGAGCLPAGLQDANRILRTSRTTDTPHISHISRISRTRSKKK